MKLSITVLLKSVLRVLELLEAVGTGVLKNRIKWAIAKLSN